VGHGAEAEALELYGRLQAAGIQARTLVPEGWTITAVDVPWLQLTDHTRDVEQHLAAA
jgi:hypothetical protein